MVVLPVCEFLTLILFSLNYILFRWEEGKEEEWEGFSEVWSYGLCCDRQDGDETSNSNRDCGDSNEPGSYESLS